VVVVVVGVVVVVSGGRKCARGLRAFESVRVCACGGGGARSPDWIGPIMCGEEVHRRERAHFHLIMH
jgi:hypothetical protein